MNDIILVILALAFLLQDRENRSIACPSFAAGKVILPKVRLSLYAMLRRWDGMEIT